MTAEEIRAESASLSAESAASRHLLDIHKIPLGEFIEASARRSQRRAELTLAMMDDLLAEFKRILERL